MGQRTGSVLNWCIILTFMVTQATPGYQGWTGSLKVNWMGIAFLDMLMPRQHARRGTCGLSAAQSQGDEQLP